MNGVTAPCWFYSLGVAFNPATSTFTTLQVGVARFVPGDLIDSVANLNPNPGPTFAVSQAPYPPPYAGAGDLEFSSYRITGRDGALYVINHIQPAIAKFDPVGNQWVKLVGTGMFGNCPDGTVATQCNANIADAFIDGQSHIYFVDGGVLRTVDESGKVFTLVGQPFFFGDGKLALSARFNVISMIDEANDGSVFVLDPQEIRLRKFQNGGTIQTVAGTGNVGSPDTTDPATNQPIYTLDVNSYWDSFVVNPSNGDVFMCQGPGSISRLDHTTGIWTTMVPSVPLSGYPLQVMGFDGVNVLAQSMEYDLAQQMMVNDFLRLYPLAGGSATDLVGNPGADSPDNNFCADGTAASSCPIPSDWSPDVTLSRETYDSTGNRWLLLGYNTPAIRSVGTASGSTMQTLVTLPRNATAFAYQSQGSPAVQTLYYCGSNGQLYKNDLNGNDTLLPLPFPGMSCTGRALLLNTTTNSLIFIYTENGLNGIGEYSLN